MSLKITTAMNPKKSPAAEPPTREASASPPAATTVRHTRRPALIGLGIALAVLCALGGVFLFRSVTTSQTVVAMATTVKSGQIVTRDNLIAVEAVPDARLDPIPADQASTMIIGKRALVDLAAGSIVSASSVGDYTLPSEGKSIVGLLIKYGSGPTNIDVGSRVRLIMLPPPNSGPTTNTSGDSLPQPIDGSVTAARPADDGSGILLDVTVDREAAAPFQAAAAQGLVTVVQDPLR